MILLRSTLACFILLLCGYITPLTAQLNLQWTKPAALNAGLPPSVEAFQTTTPLPGGVALRAFYVVADLRDPNIELKAVAGGGAIKTPLQYAQDETDPVWGIVNGGFFSGNQNLSLVLNGGAVIAPNVKQVTRTFNGANTPYFPTRGAFGVRAGNQPDVAWIYNVGTTNSTYFYPVPSPNAANAAPQAQPSETFPAGGALWNASVGIGGSPVLVADGVKRITATEELIDVNNAAREPRTAVGYLADGRTVLLVVEGRNPGTAAGVTLDELADIMLQLGCREALNLDGGGSSALFVNGQNTIRPADAGILRGVPSAFMVKRRPQIFDTENTAVYTETGTWASSANAGFGTSNPRQIVVGNGSARGVYVLRGLPAARYELGAWWSAATNRATNVPYTIRKLGGFAPQTVRANQTLNGSRFNTLATIDLSDGDSIIISNDALPAGAFVNIDALRLSKVGESVPTLAFDKGDANDHVRGTDIAFAVTLRAPSNGVRLRTLRIFKQTGAGAETQVGADIPYTNTLNETYNFTYNTAADNFGALRFRFEIEDSQGRKTSRTYTANLTPLTQVTFTPVSGIHETGKELTISLNIETRRPEISLRVLRFFRQVDNGPEVPFRDSVLLSGPAQTFVFRYNVVEPATSVIRFRFEAVAANGEVGQRTYTARIVPRRGDFRIAVVSDLNSDFGALTYEPQVDSIMQRIPRLWRPDWAICGGDMVAGQSSLLTRGRLDSMWNAFDVRVAKPFRDARIPFAFTIGNHDAARNLALERDRTRAYWRTPGKYPGMHPVDTTNYPFYYSFLNKPDGDIFAVAWDAGSGSIPAAEIAWTRQQFASPAAKKAKYRFLVGHMPLYGVAQERDSPGNVLPNPDTLRRWMEELGVSTYISGHQHAYFPGKRGALELLNAGAAGSGARRWLTIDKAPVNTVTLMDVFYAEDTIVYTTYDIRAPRAEEMARFDDRELPEIINGFQGFVLRRDVALRNTASGRATALHLVSARPESGSATAQVTLTRDSMIVTGSYTALEGLLLRDRAAIGLYRGQHGEDGPLLAALTPLSSNGRMGQYRGGIALTPDVRELLTTGNYYLLFRTLRHPQGEIRTQLYPNANQMPPAPRITSQNADEVYAVRNIPGFFTVNWTVGRDPETNPVTYIYQLATDSTFVNTVRFEGRGRNNSFSLTQAEWYALLGNAPENQPVTFYHRVFATDGRNVALGATQRLRLSKSNAPVSGSVEVLPPNFQFDCSAGIDNITLQCSAPFARSGAFSNLQGLTVDKFGRIWYGNFGGGIFVQNPDGTPYKLTAPELIYTGTGTTSERVTGFRFKGGVTTISAQTGFGTDADGNVLVATVNRIVKFDAATGKPLARWTGPTGINYTNPTADRTGRVFFGSVVGNRNFILKQSTTQPDSFDVIRNDFVLEGRELARSSAMAPNGRAIYVPANSGRNIHKYTSENGVDFTLEKIILSPSAGGCNSVVAPADNVLYAVVNASGPQAARLAIWDDNNNTFSTRELPEVTVNFPTQSTANMRGIALPLGSRDTFYTANNAFGSVYRYTIPKGPVGPKPVTRIPDYRIRQVRPVKANGAADSIGIYCRLRGVVNSPNFNAPNGLDFSIVEGGYAIQVLRDRPLEGFALRAGDSIAAMGYLRQAGGLLSLNVDSIRVIAAGRPLTAPRSLRGPLVDSLESLPIQINRALVIPAQWTPGRGYLGFTAFVFEGATPYSVFVNSTTDVFSAAEIPTGEVRLRGIGTQYVEQLPFTTGYQIMPRSLSDLTWMRINRLEKDTLIRGASFRIPLGRFGTFDAGNIFTVEISDPTGNFANGIDLSTTLDATTGVLTTAPLPADAPTGSGFRIRVRSSAPVLLSAPYAIVISRTVGINTLADALPLRVAPNPTTDVITITLDQPDAGDSWYWQVIDAAGRAVLEGRADNARMRAGLPVSLSALPAGVYRLRVRDDKGRTGATSVMKE